MEGIRTNRMVEGEERALRTAAKMGGDVVVYIGDGKKSGVAQSEHFRWIAQANSTTFGWKVRSREKLR